MQHIRTYVHTDIIYSHRYKIACTIHKNTNLNFPGQCITFKLLCFQAFSQLLFNGNSIHACVKQVCMGATTQP